MKIRTLIKIALLVTGSLCVLSTILQEESLEFYVKPMTVPLFFMLYWFNVKKVDVLFLLILGLCFLGDIFLLTQLENGFVYVLLSYASCYSILFYYLYLDYKPSNYTNQEIVFLSLFFVGWTAVVYEIYDLTYENMGDVKPYGIVYMLLLYFLLLGSVFRYVNTRSHKSLWFLIAVVNFVICDTCYALDMFYISMLEFKIISAIYQLLAVYFLVKYTIASPLPQKLKEH